jgi:hypothetical protein
MSEILNENQPDSEEIIDAKIDSVDLSSFDGEQNSVNPELNLKPAEKTEALSPALTDSDISGSEEFSLEGVTSYSVVEVNGRFDLQNGEGQLIGGLVLPEDAGGFYSAVRQAETSGRGVWRAEGETHLYLTVMFKNSDGSIECHSYSKELAAKEDEEKENELKEEEPIEFEQVREIKPSATEDTLNEQLTISINSNMVENIETVARSDSEEQNPLNEESGSTERRVAIDFLMESVFRSAEFKTEIQTEVNFEVGTEKLAEPMVEQAVEQLEESMPEPAVKPAIEYAIEAIENSDVAISVDNTEIIASEDTPVAPVAVETVESPSPVIAEQQAVEIVEAADITPTEIIEPVQIIEPLNTENLVEVAEAVAADKPVEIVVDAVEAITDFDVIEEFDEIMPHIEHAEAEQITYAEIAEKNAIENTTPAEIVSAGLRPEFKSEFLAETTKPATTIQGIEAAAFANLERGAAFEPTKSEGVVEDIIEINTEQNTFEILNTNSFTENGIGIHQENLPENPPPPPTQPSTPTQELPTLNEPVEKPLELVEEPETEQIESIRQEIYAETGIRLVEENEQAQSIDSSTKIAVTNHKRPHIYEQLRPNPISVAITNAAQEDLNAAQSKKPAIQLARAA